MSADRSPAGHVLGRVERPPEAAAARRRGRSLDLLELITIAWRSIRSNVLRSALTALGVIIGVAAVVALTAAGNGVTASVTERITSLGSNLLTISGSAGTGGGTRVRGPAPQTITLGDIEAIAASNDPRIAGIAPQAQASLSVKAGATAEQTTVIGTWADYAQVRNAEPAYGGFFTADDNARSRRLAVLGYQVAADLFGTPEDAVGQTLRINNLDFTVSGVLPDKGDSGFFSPNRQILVPLNTFVNRLHRNEAVGDPTVSSLYVQGSSTRTLDALSGDITTLLTQRHRLTDPTNLDFEIRNQADTLASLNAVTNTLTLFLGAIAGISLLVGGIGIMNIMLVSVTERTREIGVRKALGAKPRDILTQFLLEAMMLSGAGGLIGIGVGIGLAGVAGKALSVSAKLQPSAMLVAFVFAAMVGVFFGFYPARRASRLDPVDSLRYE